MLNSENSIQFIQFCFKEEDNLSKPCREERDAGDIRKHPPNPEDPVAQPAVTTGSSGPGHSEQRVRGHGPPRIVSSAAAGASCRELDPGPGRSTAPGVFQRQDKGQGRAGSPQPCCGSWSLDLGQVEEDFFTPLALLCGT